MARINATGAKGVTSREHAVSLDGTLDAREMEMITAISIQALHPIGVENEPRFQIGGPILRAAPRVRSYSEAGSGRLLRCKLASA
jgi:hypothetical protein